MCKEDVLGSGSFAVVYRGLYNSGKVAIKVFKQAAKNAAMIEGEASILTCMKALIW
jgi:predicted Ser/Thr protein kinase